MIEKLSTEEGAVQLMSETWCGSWTVWRRFM